MSVLRVPLQLLELLANHLAEKMRENWNLLHLYLKSSFHDRMRSCANLVGSDDCVG